MRKTLSNGRPFQNGPTSIGLMLLLFGAILFVLEFASCAIIWKLFNGDVPIGADLILGVAEIVVAVVAAAMIIFQLRQSDDIAKKESEIAESQFIMQYNQQFVENPELTKVEEELELVYLGKKRADDLDIESNRQAYVNYLVYLEGLTPLISNKVLALESIDSLFGYRYFIAVNNPALQDIELVPYASFYRGCYRVYQDWARYRLSLGLEIPMFAYSLGDRSCFGEYAGDDEASARRIKCRQLGLDDLKRMQRERVGSPNYEILAGLVYDTDPYIYPAMFGSRQNALAVLPDLIQGNEDTMFRCENIFVAEIDGRIMGLILWHRGPLDWSSDALRRVAAAKGIGLPESLKKVEAEYVGGYGADRKTNQISILNVCVCGQYRGLGVGKTMLKAFIDSHEKNAFFTLCVLEENEKAIRLYKAAGFEVVGRDSGFSLDGRRLPRMHMTRGPR